MGTQCLRWSIGVPGCVHRRVIALGEGRKVLASPLFPSNGTSSLLGMDIGMRQCSIVINVFKADYPEY
jgi:hypothetical protein